MLQLYDPGLAAAMERFLPVIRAYRVKDATDAARVQSPVPGGYALVDAWSPGAFGGSGRELPVEALRALPLRENVIVAGGIGAHNAASLIAEFAPWGIDVSSGIEDGPGMKSKIKMEQIMAIIEEVSRHETTAG
jgi:phosphoribosylanthranilate isomerase